MSLIAGVAILFTIMILTASLLVGWHYVPGLAGEWLGTMAGVLSTPFFLEGSFFCLGVIIVMSLNSWRRHRAGDEYVSMEELERREAASRETAGRSR